MGAEVDDVQEHRINQLEAKLDQVYAGVLKVLALEIHHQQTRKDVDAAHDMLRAQTQSQALLIQQVGRIDHVSQESNRELGKLVDLLTDPDRGLAVRITRMEGIQDANRHALRYMAGLWAAALVGSLGFVLKWAWEKLLP